MARVTVEDCVEKVPNRFDLVILAAHRSRAISAGAMLTINRDNDKNPVVALREIAEETIGVDDTNESLIRSLQRHVEVDEPEEEDTLELMAGAIMAGEDVDAKQYGAGSGLGKKPAPEEAAPAEPDAGQEPNLEIPGDEPVIATDTAEPEKDA